MRDTGLEPVAVFRSIQLNYKFSLGGTRTHGPLIKSQLLYQLSYEVFLVARAFNRFAGANMQQYFLICKKIIL